MLTCPIRELLSSLKTTDYTLDKELSLSTPACPLFCVRERGSEQNVANLYYLYNQDYIVRYDTPQKHIKRKRCSRDSVHCQRKSWTKSKRTLMNIEIFDKFMKEEEKILHNNQDSCYEISDARQVFQKKSYYQSLMMKNRRIVPQIRDL